MTRKVFRALTAATVEKLFIGQDEPAPDGWYASQADALAAFEAAQDAPPVDPAPAAEPESEPASRRGPGRPRKGW